MTVKLEAEGHTYWEAMGMLGMPEKSPISLAWRTADYALQKLPGCIVSVSGRVDREFSDTESAVVYIKEVLLERDKWIEEHGTR